jgi:hypothetical protein
VKKPNPNGAFGKCRHKFGPFLLTDEQLQEVVPAGFKCLDCLGPVRKLKKVVPGLVARMVLYTCKCGSVMVWEAEKQPSGSSHWRVNIELLRASGSEVAVFNGNKPLAPDFSGLS